MPTKKRKPRKKVVRYRRHPIQWNIGTITFGVIFVYLMINVILYAQNDTVSTYEVNKNKMQKTITTTGIALRTEEIVETKTSGYLSYYAQEGSRVSKKGYVYSVDESGKVHEYLSQTGDENNAFDSESYQNLKETISVFNNYYSDDDFYEVYDFKYDLSNTILETMNDSTMKQLEEALKQSGITESYKKAKSAKSGLVSFLMDGYETLKPENITKKSFDQSTYKKEQLRTSEFLQAGSPAYKLILGDTWDVVIPVNEEQLSILQDKKTVQVNFLKDDTTLTASVSILQNKDGNYAKLHFDDYLIRYLSDRFLNIEVVLQSVSGLKIPNTALVTRELFRIPIAYLSAGSNSTDYQFNVRTLDNKGNATVRQVPADIVMKDSKYCYVSTVPLNDTSLTQGTILVQNNSKKTFKISSTKEVQGVYCVNKGYAAFKMVNVLYSNEDYSIVEESSDLSALAIYDHIILNSNTISENEKIY